MASRTSRLVPVLLGFVVLLLVVVAGVLTHSALTAEDASGRAGHGARPAGTGRADRAPSPAQVARRAVRFELPATECPDEPPYVGEEGRTEDGYPTRVVDLPTFVACLHQREFVRLDHWLDVVLTRFAADPRTEYDYADVVDAFSRNAPGRRALVRAYVAARPTSLHAAVIDAATWEVQAHEARGYETAAETTEAQFEAMRAHLARARAAFERAEALGVPTTVNVRTMLRVANLGGDEVLEARASALGEARCASCMVFWRAALATREERWGGAPGEALDKARAVAVAHPENPRLRWLVHDVAWAEGSAGGRDSDRALLAALHRIPEAERSAARLTTLARREWNAGRHDAARALVERALKQRRNDPDVHAMRAYVFSGTEPPDELTDSVRFLAIVAPDLEDTPRRAAHLAEWVVYLGFQAAAEGDVAGTDAAFERARHAGFTTEELAREAPKARRLAAAMAELRPAVAAHPDDRELVLRVDEALARVKMYEPILPYWDAYLARHPDDARALRERSGTLFNVGRLQESERDAAAACARGDEVACGMQARHARRGRR